LKEAGDGLGDVSALFYAVEAAVREPVLDGTSRSMAALIAAIAVLLRRRLGRPSWLEVSASSVALHAKNAPCFQWQKVGLNVTFTQDTIESGRLSPKEKCADCLPIEQ
jgi:hypothetical protein